MTAVFESVSDVHEAATDGSVTATEPSGWVENELGIAVQVYNGNQTPSLNTGWSNIKGGNGSSLGVRASWIIRGASAPDLDFGFASGQDARVGIIRFSSHHATTPISAFAISIDDNVNDNNDCPDITPNDDDCRILRIACNRAAEITWASITEDYDSDLDGPGSTSNFAFGTSEIIASQTATGTENAARTGGGNAAVHTLTIAIAPSPSGRRIFIT